MNQHNAWKKIYIDTIDGHVDHMHALLLLGSVQSVGDVLAAVKGVLQQRAVFNHPLVDSRVIHVDSTLLHQCFDMPIAQGIGDVPPHTHENDIFVTGCEFSAM